MKRLSVAAAIYVVLSGTAIAGFQGYATISHSFGVVTSDTNVDYVFEIVCPDCQYQMIGTHKIWNTIGSNVISIMEWGVYGVHYRARLQGDGTDGSCYMASNNGLLYLVASGGHTIPPITVASDGPWTAGPDCIPPPPPPPRDPINPKATSMNKLYIRATVVY